MINLEDELRIVLRDTAREIPPQSVRPLDLSSSAVPARLRRAGRGGRTLTALSAAAAVTGVVVVSAVLVSGSHPRHHPAGSTPPRSQPQSGQRASQPPALPPYFLELTGTGSPFYDNPLHASIKASDSGNTLAVITPPTATGTFIAITGAADDRTFVLAAQPWQPHDTSYAVGLNSGPVTFYLLRFSPGDTQPTLTRLPIPAIAASEQVAGLALAPDAARLAVATNSGMDSQQITVYSVGTGAARTWTAHVANAPLGGTGVGAQNLVDPQALSWTADGTTLAYQSTGPTPGVSMLDVSGTSGSLQADSRLVAPHLGDGGSCVGDAMITPDGDSIICPAVWTLPSAPGVPTGFAEFSARTGALVRVLDRQHGDSTDPSTFAAQVLWISPSGDELIVGSALPYANRVSVITAGQQTVLPPADQPAVPASVW